VRVVMPVRGPPCLRPASVRGRRCRRCGARRREHQGRAGRPLACSFRDLG